MQILPYNAVFPGRKSWVHPSFYPTLKESINNSKKSWSFLSLQLRVTPPCLRALLQALGKQEHTQSLMISIHKRCIVDSSPRQTRAHSRGKRLCIHRVMSYNQKAASCFVFTGKNVLYGISLLMCFVSRVKDGTPQFGQSTRLLCQEQYALLCFYQRAQ